MENKSIFSSINRTTYGFIITLKKQSIKIQSHLNLIITLFYCNPAVLAIVPCSSKSMVTSGIKGTYNAVIIDKIQHHRGC